MSAQAAAVPKLRWLAPLLLLVLAGGCLALAGPLVLRTPAMLRLRVVASSDAAADQAVKRQVRDVVLDRLAPVLAHARSLDEARRLASAQVDGLKALAESIVPSGTAVDVRLAPDAFPERRLGWLRFPAGSYETLLITLGAGQGHNWWTVLFPPFAFVTLGRHLAVVGPDTRPAFRLDGVDQPDDGGVAIVSDDSATALPVEVRFAAWDLWRSLTEGAASLASAS